MAGVRIVMLLCNSSEIPMKSSSSGHDNINPLPAIGLFYTPWKHWCFQGV